MDLLEPTGNGRTSGEISSSSSIDLQKNISPATSNGGLSPVTSKNGNSMTTSKLSANSAAEDDELYPVRTKLPVQQPDKSNFNLWSHLKNCIGKELSKISMPVQWNEPLSFLQRLSEYMNYGYLLNTATKSENAEKRLQWVATFAVSALASNLERMGKPFNPLLGETFEHRRKNFRIVCEQVGHHPPVSAFHAEGLNPSNSGNQVNGEDKHFVFRGSMYPKVKFWGKSVEFTPKGTLTVELPMWNEQYTWSNVNCVIHNVMVGTLWMEHVGTMEIVNQTTKHKCTLTFKSVGQGLFSTGAASDNDLLHSVEGFITDHLGKKVLFLYGKWTEFLCVTDIPSLKAFLNISSIDKIDANASNLPKHSPFSISAIPNSEILWQTDSKPEDASLYYNFTRFAMGLNEELPPAEQEKLCQTDCRNRPDIRGLENGDLATAASEKERLENKQREYRKPFKNKKESDWWNPRWFIPIKNEFTKEEDWKYVGGYWENKGRTNDDDDIPSIF